MKNTINYILIGLLVISNVFMIVRNYKTFRVDNQETIITYTDTIYVDVVVRDTVSILKYKYVDRYVTDTLMTIDSVYVPVNIPISKYHYTNTLFQGSDTIKYNAFLSGYKTTLDSIDISVRYPQIIENTTIKMSNKGGITYGVGVGFGYGLFYKKPDVFIGGYVGWKFK